MKSLSEKIQELKGEEAGKKVSIWERNFIRSILEVTKGGSFLCHLSNRQTDIINRLHFSICGKGEKKSPIVEKCYGGYAGGGKSMTGEVIRKARGMPPVTPARAKIPQEGKFWMDEVHQCPWCHGEEGKVENCIACNGSGVAFTKEVEE